MVFLLQLLTLPFPIVADLHEKGILLSALPELFTKGPVLVACLPVCSHVCGDICL